MFPLGIGTGIVVFDTLAHSMTLNMAFSGLTGTVTASHVHCCTAVPFAGTSGVATTTPTFTGFPLGGAAGSYSAVFDMTLAASYNPSFIVAQGSIAAAEARLISEAALGDTYWNIHTSFAPGGEIRGFLVATPEPATFGMMGASLAAAGLL